MVTGRRSEGVVTTLLARLDLGMRVIRFIWASPRGGPIYRLGQDFADLFLSYLPSTREEGLFFPFILSFLYTCVPFFCICEIFCPLLRSVRSIQHILVTKIITRIDRQSRDDSLNLINPSLIENCSTLLSNHDIIRLTRFVTKIKVRVMK